MNEDHQGTRLLLDNSLLRMEHRNLDVDGHLGIINSRIDRHRQDVASLEQRLDDLEAANALLTAKVATMEPRLCHCGWEEQPIVVEDGEREESSPSSYQTPLVASLDENQEPIPVRITTVREGQLVPVVEQEEIVSCSEPSTGRGKRSATARKSCQYILLFIRGGGFGLDVVLNST